MAGVNLFLLTGKSVGVHTHTQHDSPQLHCKTRWPQWSNPDDHQLWKLCQIGIFELLSAKRQHMTSAQLRETNTIQEHFSSLAELDQSQTVTQQSGQQAQTVITHVIVGKLIETYFLLIRDRKHKSVYPDIWYLLLKWSQGALSFFTQLLSPPLIPVSSSPLPFKTLKQKICDKSKNNYAIMAAHSCGVLLALLCF